MIPLAPSDAASSRRAFLRGGSTLGLAELIRWVWQNSIEIERLRGEIATERAMRLAGARYWHGDVGPDVPTTQEEKK